jgi:CMP-N,N'-diacetyllegionaminic acid synthase
VSLGHPCLRVFESETRYQTKPFPKIDMDQPDIVGIVPARGGSKGVPGKNTRDLGGFPLIAYSIAAGCLSGLERTIVSTDSNEIASVAREFGGEVPFLRPSDISGDKSTDREFLEHAIAWFEANEGYTPEYWALLRPTTPLRDPKTIDAAIDLITSQPEATSLISVHEFPENPGKMFGMSDNYLHGLCPLDPRPEYFALPRQDFAPAYFGNGYIDIVRTSTIREMNSCFGSRMLGFETPDTGEIDIEDDFKKVEYFLSRQPGLIVEYLTTMLQPPQ